MFIQRDDYRDFFSEIKRLDEESGRHYEIDGERALPSVTTVISFQNKQRIAEWKARVGKEVAEAKSRKAAGRGTKCHKLWEGNLQNGDYRSLEEYKTPLIQLMFNAAQSHLDTRIDNIYQQETKMYSRKLGVAGTVDLICEVDGELAIVDFKTSHKAKPEEWLEDYFVQLSAYWGMFSENTGVFPEKLVVFLVGENGDVQIVERRNIKPYLKTLQDYVNQFTEYQHATVQ